MRISDRSSDVCSSDLSLGATKQKGALLLEGLFPGPPRRGLGILGRAVLEEVGVLDAVEDGVQPGQRVIAAVGGTITNSTTGGHTIARVEPVKAQRSEEGRVGKERVRTDRSRGR